ncbi:hypothetical protein [Acinetobacter lanii]|uniref:Lipoprotein n=1 Tax=Acinetobacter lanii TaxID=2715163 RepID=A0A6G8S7W2_9GAMM|nr:hypothetical protein [Acinetobacter lanii]QIO10148.1 hypothetical protein G8D99_14805 [Acinetobacter lanii]
MYKLFFLPFFLILTACNANELVESRSDDNNEENKIILSEFSKMNIDSNFDQFSKKGEIKQVDNTEIIDNCMYAENISGNIDYLVFDKRISTATYLKSSFLGMSSSDLKLKIKHLKMINSEYDEDTYYLQHNIDESYGVKFYLVNEKVIEVTYGVLDKLQHQEGCS